MGSIGNSKSTTHAPNSSPSTLKLKIDRALGIYGRLDIAAPSDYGTNGCIFLRHRALCLVTCARRRQRNPTEREEREPCLQTTRPDRPSCACARGSSSWPSSPPRLAGWTAHGGNPPRRPATTQHADARAPVGLALEIDNGVGQPLQIQQGQRFYLNQIDMRASVDTTQDDRRRHPRAHGRLRGLCRGRARVSPTRSSSCSPTRMGRSRGGASIATPRGWTRAAPSRSSSGTSTGTDSRRRSSSTPAGRTAVGRTTTSSCDAFARSSGRSTAGRRRTAPGRSGSPRRPSSSSATRMHPDRTFVIDPRATHLAVTWSLNPDRVYTIPVTHDADPPFAYGFSIDLDPVTPPRADGTYAPGSDVTFRITLRDGAGNACTPRARCRRTTRSSSDRIRQASNTTARSSIRRRPTTGASTASAC